MVANGPQMAANEKVVFGITSALNVTTKGKQ